jgi:hypothetical protein
MKFSCANHLRVLQEEQFGERLFKKVFRSSRSSGIVRKSSVCTIEADLLLLQRVGARSTAAQAA